MPPAPIDATISYGPTLVPGASDTDEKIVLEGRTPSSAQRGDCRAHARPGGRGRPPLLLCSCDPLPNRIAHDRNHRSFRFALEALFPAIERVFFPFRDAG